jgi:peptidoglycan/LPS O-acetylase OafA/YrhL
MPSPCLALSNLRTFVIVLVLAVHSVVAYLGSLPASAPPFDSPPYRWRSIPIVDSERWLGFDLFCAHQDVYLISLLFFLSGLFIWPSLTRKGANLFVHDRLLRIGVPFALAVAFLMPVASYPIYRATAVDPSVTAFWQHWLALPFWHSGPPWFLWVLLVFDFAAAAMFVFARHWGDALGRWSADPGPYLVGLVLASALVYVPMALAFTPWEWGQVGPFAVQLCRPLHYAVYFFAGLGIGARGIERGLMAADGLLARHWVAWLVAATGLFGIWLGVTALAMAGNGQVTVDVPLGLGILQAATFVLACGSSCMCLMALFLRFGNRRVAMLEPLNDNAYGMYLVHYVFVTWLQYLLLGTAIFAIVKGLIVFAATLVLSWAATVAIRRIPAAARLIGTGGGSDARVMPGTH